MGLLSRHEKWVTDVACAVLCAILLPLAVVHHHWADSAIYSLVLLFPILMPAVGLYVTLGHKSRNRRLGAKRAALTERRMWDTTAFGVAGTAAALLSLFLVESILKVPFDINHHHWSDALIVAGLIVALCAGLVGVWRRLAAWVDHNWDAYQKQLEPVVLRDVLHAEMQRFKDPSAPEFRAEKGEAIAGVYRILFEASATIRQRGHWVTDVDRAQLVHADYRLISNHLDRTRDRQMNNAKVVAALDELGVSAKDRESVVLAGRDRCYQIMHNR
jgi:hypothetical protein